METKTLVKSEIPYSLEDYVNRRAAATDFVPNLGYASRNSNFNGHCVSVSFNEYRKYYIAEYYYGERVVLERGTFEGCVKAALRYYDEGRLGSRVIVSTNIPEQIEYLKSSGFIEEEKEDKSWITPLYSEVGHAISEEKHFGRPMIAALLGSKTVEEYKAKQKELRTPLSVEELTILSQKEEVLENIC